MKSSDRTKFELLMDQTLHPAIDAMARSALRGEGSKIILPSVQKKVTASLEKAKALLKKEFTADELATYAAREAFRANSLANEIIRFRTRFQKQLVANEQIENAMTGTVREKVATFDRLKKMQHFMDTDLVKFGQSLESSSRASIASNKAKAKFQPLREYAIDLYKAGTWKSTSQARYSIWPKVQSKAKELEMALSETEGPETVYRWLREFVNSDRSAS